MALALELIALVAFLLALTNLIGLIALRFTFRAPIRQQLVPARIETFRDEDLQYLTLQRRGLEQMGFRHAAFLTQPVGVGGAFLLAVHPAAGISALVGCMAAQRWIDLSTRFRDGLVVNTTNAGIVGPYGEHPRRRDARFPHVEDLRQLCRLHLARLHETVPAQASNPILMPAAGAELRLLNESLGEPAALQVQLGLQRATGDGGFRLTWRGAARATWRLSFPTRLFVARRAKQEAIEAEGRLSAAVPRMDFRVEDVHTLGSSVATLTAAVAPAPTLSRAELEARIREEEPRSSRRGVMALVLLFALLASYGFAGDVLRSLDGAPLLLVAAAWLALPFVAYQAVRHSDRRRIARLGLTCGVCGGSFVGETSRGVIETGRCGECGTEVAT